MERLARRKMNLGPVDDRETNVQWSHGENTAHIYTCDERMITQLRKNPFAKLTAIHEDAHGVTGIEIDVPVWAVRRVRSARRIPSEANRSAARERMLRTHGHAGRAGQPEGAGGDR